MPSVVEARAFDSTSDAVDEGMLSLRLVPVPVAVVSDASAFFCAVNLLKDRFGNGTAQTVATAWGDDSAFDKAKQKSIFRQYDEACDRVKRFYCEQHGTRSLQSLISSPAHCVHLDGRQKNKPSRSTFALVRNSSARSGREWVSGKLWRSLANFLMTQIQM